MTTFRPCIGCTARKDCAIKNRVADALRGQPVTAAKIKCDLPFTEYFPPGTRVKVLVWDFRDRTDYDFAEGRIGPAKMVPATVVGPSSKKRGFLLMHLDESVMVSESNPIDFRAAWPKDVERLDEPRAPHCASCNRAFVKGECRCVPDQGGW